jgi:hypothetical protein
MSNLKVEIEKDHISVIHHGEEVVCWNEDEWNEDASIVVSIANAIRMATPDKIMELRKLVGKPHIIGCTDESSVEFGQVKYYINTMDDNGREQTTDFISDKEEADKVWEEMKADESSYDMHYYKSLIVINADETELDLIDDEVIDSYQDEDNELYE